MDKECKLFNTVSFGVFLKITLYGDKYMCFCPYIQSTLEQHGFELPVCVCVCVCVLVDQLCPTLYDPHGL